MGMTKITGILVVLVGIYMAHQHHQDASG